MPRMASDKRRDTPEYWEQRLTRAGLSMHRGIGIVRDGERVFQWLWYTGLIDSQVPGSIERIRPTYGNTWRDNEDL